MTDIGSNWLALKGLHMWQPGFPSLKFYSWIIYQRNCNQTPERAPAQSVAKVDALRKLATHHAQHQRALAACPEQLSMFTLSWELRKLRRLALQHAQHAWQGLQSTFLLNPLHQCHSARSTYPVLHKVQAKGIQSPPHMPHAQAVRCMHCAQAYQGVRVWVGLDMERLTLRHLTCTAAPSRHSPARLSVACPAAAAANCASVCSTAAAARGSRNTRLRAASAASAPVAAQRCAAWSAYAKDGKKATTPCSVRARPGQRCGGCGSRRGRACRA